MEKEKQVRQLSLNSKGVLYEKSKDPAEGFTEVIYGDNQKTYHKFHPTGTIEGKIFFININDKFAKTLNIGVENNTNIDWLNIPFYSKGEKISTPVKQVIKQLPSVNFEDTVKFTGESIQIQGSEYAFPVLKIINAPANKEYTDCFRSELPKPVKEQHLDKIIYNYVAQDNFLYEKLLVEIDRLRNKDSVNTVASGSVSTSGTSERSVLTQPTQEVDEIDELPF